MRCDRCTRPPAIYLRYSGQHLCKDHYLDLLRRRFRKEVRAQGFKSRSARVGIALSGGKDSVLLAEMAHELISVMKGVSIISLTVDEGIADYRPSSIAIAKDITEKLSMEHDILSFTEIVGKDLDELVGLSELGPCTICGILRRKALNLLARRNGCTHLMTGHNLDDFAQTVLMNVLSADVVRLIRLGPHSGSVKGFVPRLMPLRTTPETETYLAAHLLSLPIHDRECPYAHTARRGHIRKLVMLAEDERPGTRHSLLRFADEMKSMSSFDVPAVASCMACGEVLVEPEDRKMCRCCRMLTEMGVMNDAEKDA
ncbi:MAG: ATP-binding protein [Candidatus Thermoplasmatota archaeon]|nr:ATP-binding protein [Candidatus Thermoplasmatota archaeon]